MMFIYFKISNFLDREQGGLNNISAHGIKLHSILKTNDVIKVLLDGKKITKEFHDKTLEFLNFHNNIMMPNEPTLSNHVSNNFDINFLFELSRNSWFIYVRFR